MEFEVKSTEIISATNIRAIRRSRMRLDLQNKMIKYARNHYLGYTTTTHDCPSWLREELVESGYRVFIFGTNNDRVQILFGEEETK